VKADVEKLWPIIKTSGITVLRCKAGDPSSGSSHVVDWLRALASEAAR
jgi:hypothetical protein